MNIVITEWALQSYLKLRSNFSVAEYHDILRPDAKLLTLYPHHPKFDNDKFWGPCKDKGGKVSSHGFKMKWHQIGSGHVQLRLLLTLLDDTAYLCNAYVKDNEQTDLREMSKMKTIIQLIQNKKFIFRGSL